MCTTSPIRERRKRRFGRRAAGGVGKLQIVAAGAPVDVQHFAADKQSGMVFQSHGFQVDLSEIDTA